MWVDEERGERPVRLFGRDFGHDASGAEPAGRHLDIKSHRPAFIERSDIERQIGAMNEHIAAFVARDKAIAFGLIEELHLAFGAHVFTCD